MTQPQPPQQPQSGPQRPPQSYSSGPDWHPTQPPPGTVPSPMKPPPPIGERSRVVQKPTGVGRFGGWVWLGVIGGIIAFAAMAKIMAILFP